MVTSLFKYGALTDYSESIFESPTVWFSKPGALNDPFECRPWFSFNGSDEQLVELYVEVAHQAEANLSTVDALEKALTLFKDGRHKHEAVWEAVRQTALSRLSKDIGIYCMSARNDSILMWSHYAKNHEGYCLEFHATSSTPFFGEAQKVRYANEFPLVDFFNTPSEEQVDLIFLTKYEGWGYEQEYRIVDYVGGAGLHSYSPELLKSVTFGLRMTADHKNRIRSWLKKREQPVKLYQAHIDDREFKISIVEVVDEQP